MSSYRLCIQVSVDQLQQSFSLFVAQATLVLSNEFYTVYTKLAEMAILYSKDKKLPPVGLELIPEIISGLGVQCLTK